MEPNDKNFITTTKLIDALQIAYDVSVATPEPALSDTDKASLKWARLIVADVVSSANDGNESSSESISESRYYANNSGELDDIDIETVPLIIDRLIEDPAGATDKSHAEPGATHDSDS